MEWTTDCVGFCTGSLPADLAVFAAGALWLWVTTRSRLRARPPHRRGRPGRVAAMGAAGFLLGMAMLGTGAERVCQVSPQGLRGGCRIHLKPVVLVHGTALTLVGLSNVSVSRDLLLQRSGGRAPLSRPGP